MAEADETEKRARPSPLPKEKLAYLVYVLRYGLSLERWLLKPFEQHFIHEMAHLYVKYYKSMGLSDAQWEKLLEIAEKLGVPAPGANMPSVVLVMEGGLIQSVYSDKPIQYVVKNWDESRDGRSTAFMPSSWLTPDQVCTHRELWEIRNSSEKGST